VYHKYTSIQKKRTSSDLIDVCFRDFNVYKCFALFIRQVLPITTNTIQTFIHKFMEKGNSQQSNNNLKIYKKTVFTHLTYIQNVST
jgi:hypothetical protein